MPVSNKRVLLIVLAVAAVAVAIYVVGYELFSSGDDVPGNGRGTSVETTP
jgi:hypothetical protein